MRAVIQQLLETEAEARGLVELAKAEAENLLSRAQKQAQELLAQVRLEAKAEADRILETAHDEAEREKQQRLARAIAEIEAQLTLDETTRQRAVAGAIVCVCEQR